MTCFPTNLGLNRRRTRLNCWLILLLLLGFRLTPAAASLAYEHRQTNEPWSIHILKVDPSEYSIIAVRARDQGVGRESVASIAKRSGALAAVNGGFFKMGGSFDGDPLGILKIEDRWFSDTRLARGAIGWSDGGLVTLFDRVAVRFAVEIGEEHFEVDGLNRVRGAVETVVYTDEFNGSTLAAANGRELVIGPGGLVAITREGNASIPRDGFVVSFGTRSERQFGTVAAGTPATLLPHFDVSSGLGSDAGDWGNMEYIIGGAPLLIREGEPVKSFGPERVQEDFIDSRHPRTAVGVTREGRWIFVVVDGRRPSVSEGMTLSELTQLLLELGCADALNLDGGGSSTFYLYGNVLNLPSDLTGDRPVSDAILVVER